MVGAASARIADVAAAEAGLWLSVPWWCACCRAGTLLVVFLTDLNLFGSQWGLALLFVVAAAVAAALWDHRRP
ncbi:hypothetical protein P3T36_004264 [Kitasatospora sp. MAP12-15]|nr:hypothetical protein [Kitasatospora sp. MAP12-44]